MIPAQGKAAQVLGSKAQVKAPQGMAAQVRVSYQQNLAHETLRGGGGRGGGGGE
ncbi:hypothetical protein IAI43_11850, partial [Streptococcus pseudopneumoniae]|nr:hypothetical protein [Streptococcus pseudopneumoniae]